MAGRKKDTAHRPATPWLPKVKTRDGRLVKNTAYDPNATKTGGRRITASARDELKKPVTKSESGKLSRELKNEIRETRDFVKNIDYTDSSSVMPVKSDTWGTMDEARLTVSPALAEAQRRVEKTGEKIVDAIDSDVSDRLGDKYEALVDEAARELEEAERGKLAAENRQSESRRMRALLPPRTHPDYPAEAEKFNEYIRETNKLVNTVNGKAGFDASRELAQERAKSAAGILAEIRDFGGDLDFAPGSKKATMKKVSGELEAIPSDWLRESNDNGEVYVAGNTKGGALGTYSDMGRVKLTGQARKDAGSAYHIGPVIQLENSPHGTIHELGHRFEAVDEKRLRMSHAFVASQESNGAPDSNGDSEPGVIGRKGKGQRDFAAGDLPRDDVVQDRYSYVVYTHSRNPRGMHTEVLSTGLEALFGGGPKSAKRNRKRDAHTMGILATL